MRLEEALGEGRAKRPDGEVFHGGRGAAVFQHSLGARGAGRAEGQDLSLAPSHHGWLRAGPLRPSLSVAREENKHRSPPGRHHREGRDGHGPAGELLSARGSPQVDSRPRNQGHRPKLADWGSPGRAAWPASAQLCDPGGHRLPWMEAAGRAPKPRRQVAKVTWLPCIAPSPARTSPPQTGPQGGVHLTPEAWAAPPQPLPSLLRRLSHGTGGGSCHDYCSVCGCIEIEAACRTGHTLQACNAVALGTSRGCATPSTDIFGKTHTGCSLLSLSKRVQGSPCPWPRVTGPLHGRIIVQRVCPPRSVQVRALEGYSGPLLSPCSLGPSGPLPLGSGRPVCSRAGPHSLGTRRSARS